MKKLLLSFLMCMLAVVGMRAETATLSFADKAQRTEFSNSKQVWEQNGIILTNNKASSTNNVADYAKPARFYANSQIIVECSLGLMTQIVFDCNSSSYATSLKSSLSTSGVTTTISSDKVTVKFATPCESYNIAKLSAQIRMDALTVTYETSEQNPSEVDTPTFDPVAGEVKAGTVVTISTNSGSTLKYTVNGVANTSDDNKAYVTINEETTIVATATAADGVTVSESATAVYTIKPISTYANIATLVENATKDEDVILSGTVTVTHDAGGNLYVTDATGSLMIFGTSGNYKNGDRLTGISGTYSPYNGLPEIAGATLPATESGEAVAPVVMTVAEVNALTKTQYSRYIKMENVTISGVSGKNATLTDDSGSVALYNQFALGTDAFKNGENLTIIAVIGYFNKLQVQPIEIEENEQPGEGGGETPEFETLTYNVTVPAKTPACYIVGEFNDWDSFIAMTKVDNTHYTITLDNATKSMQYKYTCGYDWEYVEMQADGVTDVQNRTWSENDVVAAWKSIPSADPEQPETLETLIYNVTVPAGTPACYIFGDMTNWTFIPMSQVDETHYTITINRVARTSKYKYSCGDDRDYVEVDADGNDVANRTYHEDDVVKAWKSTPDNNAITNVTNDNITVYGANGVLHINATEATQITIYNAQGVLVGTANVEGNTTIQLARGLYIVNNKKVLVF
jgi:hypothetical protein